MLSQTRKYLKGEFVLVHVSITQMAVIPKPKVQTTNQTDQILFQELLSERITGRSGRGSISYWPILKVSRLAYIYSGFGWDTRNNQRIGCKKSKKYNQICEYDEAKFEGMLGEYCGKDKTGQNSEVDNRNFGLFNIVSDNEKMDAREYVTTEQCPWHITDTIECLILGFILAIVLKFLYSKWQVYRVKKAEKKLNGIRVIYKQALE